ncbi:peptidoglycan-associated lipoprotein [Bacterioplanes sanyensis]|uniref:Peptidoglycan-associated lipoprotein n=1 Tax=Bacterioplanes sanyensis TaxID=1249553 RepID=A0A222FLB5_9GAMM|nr:peptidoglycan-associated lipoprotein Pal [Bacterioplanes sanyensis]ASP39462.1 peptidoglycan-associated lipoprotein [Bacterioplanes sanyensis]
MQKTALYKALGLTLSAVLISACSSTGEVSEGGSSNEPVATEADGNGTTAVDTSTVSGKDMAAENEAAALREQTVFYFDFDQSTLKADGKPSLMAHAAYLKNNPATRVVLEGHADERGTVEYNLALGERRAMTVRRFLMANGAAANQLEVVSFGEERPAMTGASETSYAKNRRVEVKYQR